MPYRAEWAPEFARIAAELRRQLGDLAARIDHIGSTSVPGLAAKDVIDIQITVNELDGQVARALGAAGYELTSHRTDHVPPGADPAPEVWTKLLFKARPGECPAHIHVRMDGMPNQRFPLLFRDYLRSNSRAAEAYARVKRALASLHPNDMEAYTAVKDPVVDLIVEAAEAWALQTKWKPGASDA